MSHSIRILLTLLFLGTAFAAARAQGGNVFIPISKYIEMGDSESL